MIGGGVACRGSRFQQVLADGLKFTRDLSSCQINRIKMKEGNGYDRDGR